MDRMRKAHAFLFPTRKKSYWKNQINSIFDKNNKEVSSKNDIEQAHTDFYTDLYSKGHIDLQAQVALLSNISNTLDETERGNGEMELPEITSAVNALPRGKTPGPDGLP